MVNLTIINVREILENSEYFRSFHQLTFVDLVTEGKNHMERIVSIRTE